MMRHFRIFLLHAQQVLEYRSRSFVWWLNIFFNASIYLLFWRGALLANPNLGWSFPQAMSYYLLLMIIGASLQVHIEEDIAYQDIQQGRLVQFLTKPYAYFWFKFQEELPYRLLQGSFGIVLLLGISLYLGGQFVLIRGLLEAMLIALVILLGFFIAFVFKMILGIAAFWFIDTLGLFQSVTVVYLIFSGFVMPLSLFPQALQTVAYILPFAYQIYFPIISLQGLLNTVQLSQVIIIQLVWLGVLLVLYQKIWKAGLRLFSGVGQ